MKDVTVLAVDGGGTGCRAVLYRDGHVRGYTQGGSCNYHSMDAGETTQVLTDLFTSLIKNQPLQVNCVVLGLAGLDTQQDQATLTLIVKKALIAAQITADKVYLCNDAILTLKGSVGHNHGVLIVAGTGSIACGVTIDGREVRVGGWGYRVGDEGSGYSIGKAAITHILRSHDGREQPSGITAAVLKRMSFADETQLVHWIYSSQFSIARMAGLAPIIVKLAEEGDQQGIKIIQWACQELEVMVVTVVEKLGLAKEKFSLVLSGGVLKSSLVHRQVIERLTNTYGQLQISPSYQPLCANLRYGLLMVGIDHDTLLDRLAKELHNLASLPES